MILRMIWSLFKTRRDARWQDGYDWAAGSLLSRRLTVSGVHDYVKASRLYGRYNEFDEGAEAAVRDWEKREKEQGA